MTPIVYFIPGRGERLGSGVSRLMESLGWAIQGREIASDFGSLPFREQLLLIRSDVVPAFWRSDALLVGRSYGAYLLAHALADLEPFPGRVVLFSPVLGAAVAKNGRSGSRPPLADKLVNLAEAGKFPAARSIEIHTGADDNGCDPELATRFVAGVANAAVHVVPGAGHQLDEAYLQNVLARC